MRVFLCLGAALLFPLVFAADVSTTLGEISELLHRVDQDLIIDLINYIYERAKWENPFDTKWAKEGEFHIDEKKIVKMPFISRKRRYKVAFTDEATVVSIPCNGDTDALFILPETGEAFEIQQKVNEEAIHSWEKSMHKRDVDIFLPKFSVAGTYHLNEILSNLNLDDIFSGSADPSGITEGANTRIEKVFRRAVHSVNEEGPEAAGGTEVKGTHAMLPAQLKIYRPFILLLYDPKTKSVLFPVRVSNPIN